MIIHILVEEHDDGPYVDGFGCMSELNKSLVDRINLAISDAGGGVPYIQSADEYWNNGDWRDDFWSLTGIAYYYRSV